MLTASEQKARDEAQALAMTQIAARTAKANADDAAWDLACKSFTEAEATTAVASADAALTAESITPADHANIVKSIGLRTRHARSPEAIKASFEAKMAAARGTGGTSVDALTPQQKDALWESL
jgi:hypothetical protein